MRSNIFKEARISLYILSSTSNLHSFANPVLSITLLDIPNISYAFLSALIGIIVGSLLFARSK